MEKLDWQRTVQGALNSVYSLGELVNLFTREQYGQAPVEFLSSGVGGHVRHCLHHFDALTAGLENGLVDYETRARKTAVEYCQEEALIALQQTAKSFEKIAEKEVWSRTLQVVQLLDSQGTRVVVDSTLARELTFVASHTVHHKAMISVLAHLLKVEIPKTCGLAPSTAVYFKEVEKCAR